jgi:hypothetical protein
MATWNMHNDYATVLFAATKFGEPLGNPYWPMFVPGLLQWYPLLDHALRACVHRLTPPATSLKEDEEVMERARKRPRLY